MACAESDRVKTTYGIDLGTVELPKVDIMICKLQVIILSVALRFVYSWWLFCTVLIIWEHTKCLLFVVERCPLLWGSKCTSIWSIYYVICPRYKGCPLYRGCLLLESPLLEVLLYFNSARKGHIPLLHKTSSPHTTGPTPTNKQHHVNPLYTLKNYLKLQICGHVYTIDGAV